MAEASERRERIKGLDEGEMKSVAEKLARNEDVPAEDLEKYKQKYEELLSEPILKSSEEKKTSEEFSPQDLKDAVEVLREDRGIEITGQKLTHDQEIELSQMKVAKQPGTNWDLYSPEKIDERRQEMLADNSNRVERDLEQTPELGIGRDSDREKPEVEGDQDGAEGIVIEGDARELRWDENLDRDLNMAAREPRRWIDPADHSKGLLPDDERAGYQQKINEATARLGTRGYDVRILKDREGRKRVAGARRIVFGGMDSATIGMTTDEAEQILDGMNIDAKKAREEGEKRRAEPRPTVDRPGEDPPRADERTREPRVERGAKRKFEVNSVDDLNRILDEIDGIADLNARTRRLGKLADQMFDEGHNGWGNLAASKRAELGKRERSSNIIGLPDNRESLPEWRKWLRARIAGLLNPSARESGKNPGNIFSVVSETPFGRQNADGSLYMPSELGDEIFGKIAPDGGILEQGEVQAANEIGKLYENWRKAHRKMKGMIEVIERGEYKLPSNDLNKFLLNELKSEDGTDREGGSKNIAKALRIYWAMAHNKGEEGKNILHDENLENIQSLFNNQLTDEEIGNIRGQIARECGGTFYENIGLMYAGFFGITAYGSDNTAPGIQYADAMGLMIHTEIQRYSKNVVGGLPVLNEADRLSAGKRATRYLDDTVANALVEYTWDGKPKIVEAEFLDENKILRRGRDYIPVSLGKHSGNIQSQKDAKQPEFFYVIKERGVDDKYKIAKRIDDSPDRLIDIRSEDPDGHTIKQTRLDTARYEETSLDTLIKQGRINEIDWGDSVDLAGLTSLRERSAVTLYKLYKNLEDDLTKLTKAELVAKKETFEDSMPEYNRATIQNAAYLWMYSLIASPKNEHYWVKDDKKDDLKLLIKNAISTGLISVKDAERMGKVFRLNLGGDASKLWDGTYSPFNWKKK